jgi:hypothetical protein
MVTVRYADEDPVTYLTEKDRRDLEQVKHELGLTIREIVMTAHIIIKTGLDPVTAIGPEFMWSHPSEFGISSRVPEPYANVNVEEAFEHALWDAKACQRTLENDGSVKGLVQVIRNVIAWARFWSVRSPTQELRDGFVRQLEDRLAALEELRSKAVAKGRLGLATQLTENEDGGEEASSNG